MNSYTLDMTLQTYGPIETTGDTWGDLDHPMNILYVCPVFHYHCAQKPVEVQLS